MTDDAARVAAVLATHRRGLTLRGVALRCGFHRQGVDSCHKPTQKGLNERRALLALRELERRGVAQGRRGGRQERWSMIGV